MPVLEVRGRDDFDGPFAAMARDRAAGVFVVADSLFMVHRARVAALAGKIRVPSFVQYMEIVEAGALMSYGPSLPDLGRRAADYVDKIVKGARPADLPVQQPTTLHLVINMKTAKALGLTIPPSLLLRADQIIE